MKIATKHKTQYFEMIGNRGVYDNGWVACTTPRRLPWQAAADSSPDDFKWGLYNIAEDFSEANNHAHAYRNTNSYSYTETSDDLPEQAR